VKQHDEQWTRSAMEAATSSAQTLLQLRQAADVFGDSPIAVPALRRTPRAQGPVRFDSPELIGRVIAVLNQSLFVPCFLAF